MAMGIVRVFLFHNFGSFCSVPLLQKVIENQKFCLFVEEYAPDNE